MTFYRIVTLFISLSLFSCAQEQDLTTFIIMRHAEKVLDGSKDPMLLPIGVARSERLRDMLFAQDITAIYSTPYQRTMMTVSPLARQKDLEILKYEPHDKDFLDELFKLQKGKKVVIVGHSNTINMLVNELIGADKIEARSEDQYSDLFVVTALKIGEGSLTHLIY